MGTPGSLIFTSAISQKEKLFLYVDLPSKSVYRQRARQAAVPEN